MKRRKELEATDETKRQGVNLKELYGCKDRNYLICNSDPKINYLFTGLLSNQILYICKSIFFFLIVSISFIFLRNVSTSFILQHPIPNLVGKTIGLYFGAHWCPPSRAFTKLLIETYNELENSENGSFKIVFISMDRDENEFMASLKEMPWLAIPYSDKSRHDLSRIFNIKWIPSLIILGANGETISRDGRTMIARYGSLAFPFTEKRSKEVERMLEEEGERLPRHVSDPRHEHLLKLDMARNYVCDVCQSTGRFWVFSCSQCDFDLHPSCHRER